MESRARKRPRSRTSRPKARSPGTQFPPRAYKKRFRNRLSHSNTLSAIAIASDLHNICMEREVHALMQCGSKKLAAMRTHEDPPAVDREEPAARRRVLRRLRRAAGHRGHATQIPSTSFSTAQD